MKLSLHAIHAATEMQQHNGNAQRILRSIKKLAKAITDNQAAKGIQHTDIVEIADDARGDHDLKLWIRTTKLYAKTPAASRKQQP